MNLVQNVNALEKWPTGPQTFTKSCPNFSTSPERSQKENFRSRLGLSVPHPSPYPTFYHSLLFFSTSQDDLCLANSISFQNPSLLGTVAKKSIIKCAFLHWNCEGYKSEERVLSIFSFSIFLCPYDGYFQPYSFHDCFPWQSLTSAHVPPSELKIWNFCLRGFCKTIYPPTFR